MATLLRNRRTLPFLLWNKFNLRYLSTISQVQQNAPFFPLLPEDYTNLEIYKQEKQLIFDKEWTFFCLEDQIPKDKPGSYFSTIIADRPIFVIRDRNGSLKGYHNVCRHRANQLVPFEQTNGQCDLLRCKYHGWIYDTNGNLKVAPGIDKQELNKQDFSLFPVHVQTYKGLVFVNSSPHPPTTLEQWLGPSFFEIFSQTPFDEYSYVTTVHCHVNCNWKVYVDNYQEAYHLPLIHPLLHSLVDTPKYEVKNYKDSKLSHHTVPSRDGSPASGLWVWKYPNLAMNVYRDYMSVELMNPVGHNKTRLCLFYLLHKQFMQDEKGNKYSQEKVEQLLKEKCNLSNIVIDEDFQVCENVQKNLEANIYKRGVLSQKWENGVRFFHELVRESFFAK